MHAATSSLWTKSPARFHSKPAIPRQTQRGGSPYTTTSIASATSRSRLERSASMLASKKGNGVAGSSGWGFVPSSKTNPTSPSKASGPLLLHKLPTTSSANSSSSSSSATNSSDHDGDAQGEKRSTTPGGGGGGGIMGPLSRFWESQRSQSKQLKDKIQELGTAGVVAYGILNSLYYSVAFTFFWVFVAQAPRGLGVSATTAKVVQVAGLTWAGSQVTKIPRAGCAVLLAPFVERMAKAIADKMKFKSLYMAYGLVLGSCIVLATSVFGLVILLWS